MIALFESVYSSHDRTHPNLHTALCSQLCHYCLMPQFNHQSPLSRTIQLSTYLNLSTFLNALLKWSSLTNMLTCFAELDFPAWESSHAIGTWSLPLSRVHSRPSAWLVKDTAFYSVKALYLRKRWLQPCFGFAAASNVMTQPEINFVFVWFFQAIYFKLKFERWLWLKISAHSKLIRFR